MKRFLKISALATFALLAAPLTAAAQTERLCDTRFEDCRTPLIDLIKNETEGIDVAFWFMHDARYVTELIKRHQAGVPIRILVDQRANTSKRLNEQMLKDLKNAGIPMRDRYVGDILHFKMMLFQKQDMVEFSKANYTPESFVPITPWVNYDDEAIYFTGDDNLTNTFRRRFEDLWTNTTHYQNYGNITGPLVRKYPLYPLHPAMNFSPLEDTSARMVSRFDLENTGIDAIVFRVTDPRLSDAVIRTLGRAPVRIITEPSEYRNPARHLMAKEIDRMWMAGAQIKVRLHPGLTHEAAVVLHGLGEVIFGSSNWSPPVASGPADEHNYFYNPSENKPAFFQWFANQFLSMWNDATNYGPFTPLPPDEPIYSAPAHMSSGAGTSVQLTWEGGPWAHFYDIYFGTNSNPQLLTADRQLGGQSAGQAETYVINNLQPGTTYYWRIVSKTYALKTTSGVTWSFTTAGTAPGGGGASTPFGGTPVALPGTIQIENFDEGGQSVGYSDSTAGNAGGAYRVTDVDLEPTTDTGGGFNLMKTRAGEWLKYTVNVGTAGTYRLEARVANMGTGATFHVEVDGANASGAMTVANTGGWQTWQTVTSPDFQLTAGQHVVRLSLDAVSSTGAMGNYNWLKFVLVSGTPPPPPPPPPPATTPFGGTAAPIPGTFQAENFDNGGQGVAWFDTTSGNKGNTYRTSDIDITTTTDVGGGFYIGWTRAGEWMKYTVNVTAAGTYQFQARLANMGTGATFHVEVDGVDKTGPVSVPNTGGWENWQTIAATTGIQLTAGTHVIRIVLDSVSTAGGAGNFNWFRLQ